MDKNLIKAPVLAVAGLLMLTASVAQADTITQIFALVGNDFGGWSSLSSPVANGTTVASGADTVSIQFSQSPAHPGAIYLTGTSWNQNGWVGPTYVLGSNYDGNSLGGTDTLTLTFTTPVSAFGIYAQDVYAGPFTASIFGTFSAGAGGGSSATFTAVSNANGNAQFIGISDTASSIKSVTIDVTGGDPQFYAVGPFTLTDPGGTGPIPEPASLMLMASGLAALAWKARRLSRG